MTGANGVASLAGWDLPAGSYTLSVYFGMRVPLGGSSFYDATSFYYAGAQAQGALTVRTGAVTYTGDTVVPIGTAINLRASVDAPGSDTSVAKVRYVVQDDGITIFSTGLIDKGATNNWQLTMPGLPVGVYSVLTFVAATPYASEGMRAYISVYDPSGGFVTGGGWINSPAGAFAADPGRVGKATFGFNAKYKKGSTDVTGDTEFQFSAGDIAFKSTSYQSASLVIAGRKALYKGTGTINGTGSYKFTLTAIDGQANNGVGPDTFRIKIWDSSTAALIYDNQAGAADDADPTTALGGGSIVIHK